MRCGAGVFTWKYSDTVDVRNTKKREILNETNDAFLFYHSIFNEEGQSSFVYKRWLLLVLVNATLLHPTPLV